MDHRLLPKNTGTTRIPGNLENSQTVHYFPFLLEEDTPLPPPYNLFMASGSNIPWIADLVSRPSKQIDDGSKDYQVEEVQLVGSELKSLQVRRDKIRQGYQQFDQKRQEMMLLATKILDLQAELAKQQEGLRMMADDAMAIQQIITQEIYTYNNQLIRTDKVMADISGRIYRVRNAQAYADTHKQLGILLDSVAAQKTAVDGLMEDDQPLLQAHVEHQVRRIFGDSFFKKPEARKVPIIQQQQQLLMIQPPTTSTPIPNQVVTSNMAPVVNITGDLQSNLITNSNAASFVLVNLQQPLQTTKSGYPPFNNNNTSSSIVPVHRINGASDVMPVPTTRLLTAHGMMDDYDSMDTHNYQPIDPSQTILCEAVSFGGIFVRANVNDAIPEEFINTRFGNIQRTTRENVLTVRMRPSIRIMDEYMYASCVDRLPRPNNNSSRFIPVDSVAGLINQYKTTVLLESFILPHSHLIVERKWETHTVPSEIHGGAPSSFDQQYIRLNQDYQYCQDADQSTLEITGNRNTTQTTPSIHDSQYQLLAGVISLAQNIRQIGNILIEANNSIHDAFSRYARAIPLWHITFAETFFDIYGSWMVINSPASPDFPPWIKKLRVLGLEFSIQKIAQYLVMFSRVLQPTTDDNILSPEEQMFVEHFRGNTDIIYLINLFMREGAPVIQTCSTITNSIDLIENPHWFVVDQFESHQSYVRYQAEYLETLHNGALSIWPEILSTAATIDTSQVEFSRLCARTTVVKKPATSKNRGAGTPPAPSVLSTRPTTPSDSLNGLDSFTQSMPSPSMVNDPAPAKRPRGRPKKYQSIVGSTGVNRSNFRQLISPDGESIIEDSATQVKVAILKVAKAWLDTVPKHLCAQKRVQHSYLQMRIPRTNVEGAPVPLTVPPYVLLSDDARAETKIRFSKVMQNKMHVYATDLANTKNHDTLMAVHGCRDDFVAVFEKNGCVSQSDLTGAKCKDCSRMVRMQTLSSTNKKHLNATHCFGYIPCHCRKLTRCVRCLATHWLWAYNIYLKRAAVSASATLAAGFTLPCPDCKVPWRLSEICLVSFDHLCSVSKIDQNFVKGGTKKPTNTVTTPTPTMPSHGQKRNLSASAPGSKAKQQQQQQEEYSPSPHRDEENDNGENEGGRPGRRRAHSMGEQLSSYSNHANITSSELLSSSSSSSSIQHYSHRSDDYDPMVLTNTNNTTQNHYYHPLVYSTTMANEQDPNDIHINNPFSNLGPNPLGQPYAYEFTTGTGDNSYLGGNNNNNTDGGKSDMDMNDT